MYKAMLKGHLHQAVRPVAVPRMDVLLYILSGIASGMIYIHSKGIM